MESTCVRGGSRGKRIGGFVVESSQLATACTARGRAQPTRGSQSPSLLAQPLPGVSTPQQPPSPALPQRSLAEGLTAGNGVGKTSYTSCTGETPEDCRLCGHLLAWGSSSGPQFPHLQNGRG